MRSFPDGKKKKFRLLCEKDCRSKPRVCLDKQSLFSYNKSIQSGKEFRFTIVCLPQKPEKGVLRLFCKKEFL